MFNKPILYRTLAFAFALSLSVLYAVYHLNNEQTNTLDVYKNPRQPLPVVKNEQNSETAEKARLLERVLSAKTNDKPLDLSLPANSWKDFQDQTTAKSRELTIKLEEESGLKAGNIKLSPSVDLRPLSAMERSKPLDNIEGLGVDMTITLD